MEEKKLSVFETLNKINVNGHTEKKGRLTYLSWAWSWAELKLRYPDATFRIYKREDGRNYFDDGKTAWVECGVTVEGLSMIEQLPIMDNQNRSIPVEKITSMDVNKAIKRCITKAIALHGLGLYIYAGEDLPEVEKAAQPISEKEWKILQATLKAAGIEKVCDVPALANINSAADITAEMYAEAIKWVQEQEKKKV